MIALRSLAEQLQKNRQALALAIALVGTLGALGLSTFSLFDTLERKTLDLRFRTAAHAEWADTSIVLIAVDQNSLDFVERQWQMKWPWPREYYGLLLQYLNRAHPRLIAFDYDLSQHDANRLEVDGAESDRAFADAIAVSGNVLLGVNLSIQEQGDLPGDSVHARHLIGYPPMHRPHNTFDRAAVPIPEFQHAAAALGVTNFGVTTTALRGASCRSMRTARMHSTSSPPPATLSPGTASMTARNECSTMFHAHGTDRS